jgi:hypothetical protein
MSPETIVQNVKGMAALSFICTLVSAAVSWSQIRVDDNYPEINADEMSAMKDAGNYYVFTNWAFWVPMAAAALVNSGAASGEAVQRLSYLRYFSFGIASVWISGSITPPNGPATWTHYSLENLNTLRIAVEEETKAGNFGASSDFDGGLPSAFFVPTDASLMLGGIIVGFIGGFMIYNAGTGSAGGIPFQGQLANRELAGEKVLAPGMLTATVVGAVALLLGFSAVFVLWTSDIAADPSNPNYGNVFTLIYAALFTGMNAFFGVIAEDALICEMALFSVGLFNLGAPVRLWQIESFTGIAVEAAGEGFDNTYLENDVQRLRVAVVLIVLSGLASIWCASSFLQSSYKESVAPGSTKRDDYSPNSMRKGMGAVSAICVLTGCGLLWAAANEALEAVGAENSARINGANFYIFLALIGWLGMAAQLSGLSEVKALPWVSMGVAASTLVGFLAIGTHDRQLWFLDFTLASVNELHQYLYADEGVFPVGGRSLNIDADSKVFEWALAGILLNFIGTNLIIMAVHEIPGKFERKNTWAATSSIAAKITYAIVVFFIIGISCMLAADTAAVPMKVLTQDQNGLCGAGASGDVKNLVCIEGGAVVPGERFSFNTYNPMNFGGNTLATDYANAFTWSTLGLFVAFFMLNGVLSESIRMVKFAAFAAGILWLSLSWAFVFPDGNDGGDQYRAGVVFLWLESLLTLVAASEFLAGEDDDFNKALEAVEKPPTDIAVAPGAAQQRQTFGIATTAV